MAEKQILDSWKEITTYLGRSEKTCKRLEKELGLPIHRLEDTPKARVFAYKDEIDLWIEKTKHSRKKSYFERSRLKKLIIPAIAVIVIVIVGVAIWQMLPQKTAISPSPQMLSVAVISFENQTGDHSYDYLNKVIPNLLITNLEQSPYLDVTSRERLHDLLKHVGKEDVEVIDKELGFELCQRDDIDAMVIGSFTKAADMFITDIKVLDVETKRILKSASSRGKGEESILQSQIDELSRGIYQGISESGRKTEETPMRIADVTTSSLDAYYYYLKGVEYNEEDMVDEAREYLEKAIELDPSFAMAYVYLARAYYVSREWDKGDEASKKALDYSARATEKERLYIKARYAKQVERDLEKSLRIAQEIIKKYPKEKIGYKTSGEAYYRRWLFDQAIRELSKVLEIDPYDTWALQRIALSYIGTRNYEKALECLQKYSSVSPGNPNPVSIMGMVHLKWGKLDKAIEKFKESLEIKPDWMTFCYIAYTHALKEDYLEALRWVDLYSDEFPALSYIQKSFYHYWVGRLEQSLSDLLTLIENTGESFSPSASWMMGWVAYDRGDFELCRKHFKNWLDIYTQEIMPIRPDLEEKKELYMAFYSFYLGLVDLKQAKIESAKSRLAEINALMPEVNPLYEDWAAFYHDYLNVEILLAEGDIQNAITACEKSSPMGRLFWDMGMANFYHNVPFLKDTLAKAYHQNGEIDKAIAEYEQLTTFNPQREERHLIHPKYYYMLAKLYEEKGSVIKAVEHYEKFLELWKDADPSMPEVEDARKKLAGLKRQ